MNVCVSRKDYFKESAEIRKGIVSGVEDLYRRIRSYEEQNIEFDKIFNDDKIKYDKHGRFFTFKFRKENMQFRLLYAYLIIDCVPVVIVADYYVKKKDTKSYISKFDSVNKLDPLDLYRNSQFIC